MSSITEENKTDGGSGDAKTGLVPPASKLSRKGLALLAIVFAVFGVTVVLRSHAATTVPTPAGYTLAWNDEFDAPAVDTNAWTINTGGEGHSQAYYTTADVSQSGGFLNLRTRRHCTATSTDTLTDANATTAVCPAGMVTRYSSGYLRSKNTNQAGRLEVRAKLPATQLGLWPAIWMRNVSGWCTTTYGELDTMEWYGDYPALNTNTTHYTCANGTTQHVQHSNGNGTNLGDTWHTWAMNWDANGTSYEFDGVNVPSKSGDADRTKDTIADVTGVSPDVFASIMNQQWHVRLSLYGLDAADSYDTGVSFRYNAKTATMIPGSFQCSCTS